MLLSILRLVCLFEILLQPSVLIHDLLRSVFCEKVKLGRERNDVCRANVVAPEVVAHLAAAFRVHREAVVVVGKVATDYKTYYLYLNPFTY